jgi:DNA-binding MarR family transcriptional regulator
VGRDAQNRILPTATVQRDLMDEITDGWRREMPYLERPEYELVRRAARLGQLLEEQLSECLARWSLAKGDFNVLCILRIAGTGYEMRPTDIRNRLVLTSGGISNILNRLERMKLTERVPDRSDGRSSWVRLTDAGVKMAEETMRAWGAAQDKFLSELDPHLALAAAGTLRAVLLAVGDQQPIPAATRQDPGNS